MTYNEFMSDFNQFKKDKVAVLLSRFKTSKEAADFLEVSPVTMSRLKNNPSKVSDELLIRIFGSDLKDEEIKTYKQLQIEELERQIDILKREPVCEKREQQYSFGKTSTDDGSKDAIKLRHPFGNENI